MTGAGVYNCIAYRYHHAVAPDVYYIAPGVGIVKIDHYYKIDPGEKNYPGFHLNEVYSQVRHILW